MPKISFIGIIDHASGKVCQHSDTSFVYRKKSGRTYTCRRDGDRVYHPTSAQLLQQEAFKSQREQVNAFIKSVKAKPASEGALKKLKAMYEADDKAYSLAGFVWRHMDFESNTIVVAGITYDSSMKESIQG